MDADSRRSSHDSRSVNDADGSSGRHSGQPEQQCLLCSRNFSLETEVNDGFEAICICRGCKIMVLNGDETSAATRDSHRRRQQRGRSRYGSSESIDGLFSQLISSQLISLVRQNHEAYGDGDGDASSTMQHPAHHNAVHGRARRWQGAFSDNESESLYLTDSLFGEGESSISFGGYGAESDASVDGHNLFDREMMLIQLDNESRTYTDTDIDPMHAGLDQWDSDNQGEEDGDWEEADVEEPVDLADHNEPIQDVTYSPIGSGEREARGGGWIRLRIGEFRARLDGLEGILPYVANPGDYLDTRGFEELLDQLAETGSSRRGAPPAAESVVEKLPRVVISMDHEKNGILVCPVCKDPLSVNTEAKQLPCMHLYHPSCILPWLSTRNSCPVCRYELPTDDLEYEGKRKIDGDVSRGIWQQGPAGESSSDASSDSEGDEVRDSSDRSTGQGDDGDRVVSNSDTEGGARSWLFLAAAPIVGLVGVALALWFRNPRFNMGELNRRQLQRSRGGLAAPRLLLETGDGL